MWLSPIWCSRLTSLRIECARSSAALMSLTSLFHRRSPDCALGESSTETGANLHGVHLIGASLYRADLSGVDLSVTNLMDADLREAELREANLWKADLSRANLREAFLIDSYLSETDLSRADLRDIDATNEQLEEQSASLKGATMPNGQKYEEWLKNR